MLPGSPSSPAGPPATGPGPAKREKISSFKAAGEAIMQLSDKNHAPALFADLAAMKRAKQAYTIELKDKFGFIIDLFSGQKLETRTQTATLAYHDPAYATQLISNDKDVETESYQKQARGSSRGRSIPVTAQTDI